MHDCGPLGLLLLFSNGTFFITLDIFQDIPAGEELLTWFERSKIKENKKVDNTPEKQHEKEPSSKGRGLMLGMNTEQEIGQHSRERTQQ